MKEKYRGIIAIVAVLMIFLAVSASIRVALATEIPIAAVSSGSMEPTIAKGSLIIVKGVSPEKIKAAPAPEGDIIVYLRAHTVKREILFFTFYNPEPVVHRAVKKVKIGDKWRFLTKGDANLGYDQNPNNPKTWVPEDRVLGKVVLVIPMLGYAVLFAKTPFGTALLVLLIAILLALWIRSERREHS